MEVRTLCDIPAQLLADYRKSDQILYRDGEVWQAIPTQDLCERIRSMALGFRRLGIERGDRVALLSANRPEWPATDYAILTAGGVTVPIYPTLLAEQVRYLLEDSGAKAIVVAGAEQLEKVLSIRAGLPELQEIIAVAPDGPLPQGVRTWSDLADIGGGWSAGKAKAAAEDLGAIGPDDLASIIYTSGTTGVPKGVMLTHGNFIHNVIACCAAVPFVSSDVCLSFLPLSHVYERMVEYCYFYRGATIAYAESIDTVARDLQEVRPTVACGVPRVFEKMHRRMLDAAEDFPPVRRMMFRWAMAVARRHGALAGMGGGSGPFLSAQQRLADRLVYSKLRERLGGRLRFFVTGSAPLPREIAEFFHGAGIIILEGYGLTETSPVISLNRIGSVCFGTVGKPIDGVEVKIADDGEILTRGPSVMSGYFNNEQATREVMREGWFCTGDIGRIDEHGCLVITDRKKEVLKTSGGKMIAPQPIENQLRADRFIAQAIVIGDRRKFISALLVPDVEQLKSYVERKGIKDAPLDTLLRDAKIVDLFERRVARINERLARYERIKAFRVLNREFSLENREITLTLKLRRKVIIEHYSDRIEEMYS